jgi:hypothetical protein
MNEIPKVTLVQLDTIHNQANPFKVTNYNKDTCKMEVEAQDFFRIVRYEDMKINEKLHGGFWISAEDVAKLKAYGKTECENAKLKQIAPKE